NKTSYILVSICFLLSSIFLLKGYSDIQIMRYEINQLQKQKNNLTQQKEDLYVRLEGLKNNQEIGKQAEELLGMSYPDKDQIVYIAVDDSNEINHYGFKDRIKVVIGFFLAHI
ncbi:septum formation initiator family protein, partial [Vibrio parahaemolyticus]|nr:septum formation initiator family protein [Vibrio parahaemolyticus]